MDASPCNWPYSNAFVINIIYAPTAIISRYFQYGRCGTNDGAVRSVFGTAGAKASAERDAKQSSSNAAGANT